MMLGEMARDGVGTTRDVPEAIQWFRKAAEAGLAPAQYALAGVYLAEPQNDASEAVKWLKRGAAQGHTESQLKLADMYRAGRGVDRSSQAVLAKAFRGELTPTTDEDLTSGKRAHSYAQDGSRDGR